LKLWQKDSYGKTNQAIEKFTVGKDKELDVLLAPFDILGSMAHCIMLKEVGLLSEFELKKIFPELKNIYESIEKNKGIEIEEGVEDIHSQIEFMLTRNLGEIGKKIHSGRSRNDQVLVDLKLYLRNFIERFSALTENLFSLLVQQSERYKELLLPGYTHLQIAMPSSFGLWFGAYAESLADDLETLVAAYKIINKNPLGSGAGYGSSFPLNRKRTTELLGFSDLNYNVVYAQMTRGKSEFILAQALSNFAQTISRLSMDVCLYNSQNFSFIDLPKEMTTGSSIMPHKKNPDVAEILRGKSNKLKSLPYEIGLILNNLPSGYHREMQLIKESIIPSLFDFEECMEICTFMVQNLKPKNEILNDEKFDLLYSVENVNNEVIRGMSFRDAYVKVGNEIEQGIYKPNKELRHTLEGSIGNLCNDKIKESFKKTMEQFEFSQTQRAIDSLLKYV
jgi:argininosuccinate lyase